MDREKKSFIIHKDRVAQNEDRIPKLNEEEPVVIKNKNKKLVYMILAFFGVIIFIVYFEFSFGRISTITVEGNNLLTDREIVLLSELSRDESFFELSERTIEENILSNPEVKKVEVTKKFPNKVYIQVTEYNIVGYLVNEGKYRAITEDGRIIEKSIPVGEPVDKPLLYNFTQGDELQELIGQLDSLAPSIMNSISEIYYTPTDTNPLLLNVYMNEGFKIIVSIQDFANDLLIYPSIVEDQENPGVIDLEVGVSFTPY